MARTTEPGDERTPQTTYRPDQTGRTGDLNAEELLEEAREPVHESRDFPGGGGEGEDVPAGPRGDVGPGPGSTGRNARDSGKTDAGGTPGAGMAGSAGG